MTPRWNLKILIGGTPNSSQVMRIRQETSSTCIYDFKLRFFTYVELMPKHRDFNPAVLNDGILGQLQPNPFKLNQNFIDQLNQLIQPEPIVVPMTESFDPSVNDDDIWNTDNFNILS